jgi:hypothetical protein
MGNGATMVSNEFMERHARLLKRIHQAAHTMDANTLATYVKWILDAEHAYWYTNPAGESSEWREYKMAQTKADGRAFGMIHGKMVPFGPYPTQGDPIAKARETIPPDWRDMPAGPERREAKDEYFRWLYGRPPAWDGQQLEPHTPMHRDPVSGKLVPDMPPVADQLMGMDNDRWARDSVSPVHCQCDPVPMPHVHDMVMRSATFQDVVKASTPIVDHLHDNPIQMEPYVSDAQSIADGAEMERKRAHGIVRCLCPLNFIHMKNQHDAFQEAVNKGLVPSQHFGGIGKGC